MLENGEKNLATKELQLINSVLKEGDVRVLFGEQVDDLFHAYKQPWESIKAYYNKFHQMPTIDKIQERFPNVIEDVPVSGPTEYYLDGLRNEYIENQMEKILLSASKNLSAGVASQTLNEVQQKLSALNKFNNTAKDLNIMDMDDAERHYAEVRAKAEAMGGVPGIPTGLDFIDSAYPSGFAGGDLIVVLGWTGRGKSQFTTYLACNAHDKGYKPMITSLEMSGEKVRDRVYTIKGSGLFQNSSLTLGDVSTDDFRAFRKQNEGKSEFIVVTNDGRAELTPNIMQAKIDEHKPKFLVFDYAQLGSDNENSVDMTARMRNMSKQWKRLAVANDIPVVLISSATADSSASANEPPIIEQVAWSKQLAFDADLAFAVHKWDDSDIIEIACRKNRNGPLFAGYLDWDINNGIITEKYDV